MKTNDVLQDHFARNGMHIPLFTGGLAAPAERFALAATSKVQEDEKRSWRPWKPAAANRNHGSGLSSMSILRVLTPARSARMTRSISRRRSTSSLATSSRSLTSPASVSSISRQTRDAEFLVVPMKWREGDLPPFDQKTGDASREEWSQISSQSKVAIPKVMSFTMGTIMSRNCIRSSRVRIYRNCLLTGVHS